MSLAPLQLISAHPWKRVTFTTYMLSLSFFEAVILEALVRGGAGEALILTDVQGVRASLSEQGAQRVGKDYKVEPVAISGSAFHPKLSVFADGEECHVLAGSGNLTFNGWGGNLELVEHLHPSFAADAIADTAAFFERLAATTRVRFGAGKDCGPVAEDLRRSVQGKPANGNIRLIHNLDESISSQLVQLVEDLGGATQLVAAAPFWDQGAAIDALCKALRLDEVFIHAHPQGTVEGTAGTNWPFGSRSKVHPVRLEVMEDEGKRRLHAKAFEIMCRRGRILVSGSANGSAAALEEGRNVEACVVRIQRDRSIGWKFGASEVPEPLARLSEEDEQEERDGGVLRAVLEANKIQGEVLTPAMSGIVSVSYVSNLDAELLGTVPLSSDRRFQINAALLEKKSWQAGRLVIRLEDQRGRRAEGFVSNASYADIARRAGPVNSLLMAVLTGTDTPADVAAILSWFCEDPSRLSDADPTRVGGVAWDRTAADKDMEVVVADLLQSGVAVAAAAPASAEKTANANWSRYMEQIFSAFREKREPFERIAVPSKRDDNRGDDENDDDEPDEKNGATDDPNIERSFAFVEKLFDMVLKPDAPTRKVLRVFDLAHYVCDRCEADASQETRWLERLIPALLKAGVPDERRKDVASAVLRLLGGVSTPARIRWARGYLLRLGIDLSGAPLANKDGNTPRSAIPQTKSIEELWPQLQAIRTASEQVRAYMAALQNGAPDGDFTDLAQAAEEAWPVLKLALKSKNTSRIIVIERLTDYCPEHHKRLPTGESGRLRSAGVGIAKNCCSKVILWLGG